MAKVKGDFGGISYEQGDFHTVGYSGIDVANGDYVTNGTQGLGSLMSKAKSIANKRIMDRVKAIDLEIASFPSRQASLLQEKAKLMASLNKLPIHAKFRPMNGMGDVWSDITSSIFGKEGAAQVTSSLQSGAANLATSVIGTKLAADPNAKQSVVDTAKATINQLYQDYKIPVIVITGSLAALISYGIYNAVKKK